MDVTLPNGVVLKGVPDDTPKHVIAMKAIQSGLATNKDFGYEEADSAASESGFENFKAGVGAGLVDVGRRATNLLLPDALTPEFASDEAIAEQEDIDQDLEETGSGMTGKIGGQILATYPVGGVGGGVAKGARLARFASKPGKYLTRTLQKGMGRGAVEGATVGAIFADPEDRSSGAGVGAILGGALGAGGTVLGKALGKGKVTDITREAKQLQRLTGQFIPLSQSAEAGMTKQIYNALLANIPGVGGKIRGQYKEALDDLRRFVGENAHPPKAHIEIKPTDTVETMIGKLHRYWDTAFDEIKDWPIRAFSDVTSSPPSWLRKIIEKQGKGMVKIPRSGDTLTGADILTLKTTLGEIIPTLGSKAKSAAMRYQKSLDGLLRRNLNPSGKGTGQGARILHDYEEATKFYPAWKTLQRAASKAKDNLNFTPQQLAKAAKKSAKDLVLENKSVAQRAGELGIEALEDFPSRQGLFQTLAALGAAGGLTAAGGTAGAAVIPAIVALGRLGASKGLQRYLSGQTRFQRLNKVLLRKWKTELQRLGATGRQASVILGVQDAS